jgi:hypothetical protein
MAAIDRPFTKLAAEVCGFSDRLKAGLCPTCGQNVDQRLFNNDIERAEFDITGICKTCQDKLFSTERSIYGE